MDQRAGFPRDMFAANVTQAAMEWDGRRNIDLYRLIADALGITLWEMAREIRKELDDNNDPRDADSEVWKWRQRIKDRTRLIPEPSPDCGD